MGYTKELDELVLVVQAHQGLALRPTIRAALIVACEVLTEELERPMERDEFFARLNK